MTTNKQVLLIGHNHYGRIPMIELLELKDNSDEPLLHSCKRCGGIKHVMLNGYCVECDEELSNSFK